MIKGEDRGPGDSGPVNHHFYLGQSMRGTFKPGDWLQIEKIAWGEINRGDIVVFKPRTQGVESTIVHRVISRTDSGLITRGDANPLPDVHPVTEAECLGRVIVFERGGRRSIVRNGPGGVLHARRIRAKKILIRLLFRPFRPLFSHMREHGWLDMLFSGSILEVHFDTPDGPLVKFIRNGKTIGTWWPKKKQLICGRIGRLLLWARVRAVAKRKSAG